MNKDTTIIYYTSNRENQVFEQKIRDRLLKTIGDLPLISVSQKPLPNLGTNICVGNVGTSTHNIHRQLLIGCEKATTEYVCTAEADCLYPPTGYFDFIPVGSEDQMTAYYYVNLWILDKKRKDFKRKRWSLCALFSNREYLIYKLRNCLRKTPLWISWQDHATGPFQYRSLFWRQQGWGTFEDELPVVNIKTGDGMYKKTGTFGERVKEIPYWGKVNNLIKELWI